MHNNILCLDNESQIDINNLPSEKQNPPSACLLSVLAPFYFVVFVLISQFVLINIVVAVLLKQLNVNIYVNLNLTLLYFVSNI